MIMEGWIFQYSYDFAAYVFFNERQSTIIASHAELVSASVCSMQ
jgi:hypothetical protein